MRRKPSTYVEPTTRFNRKAQLQARPVREDPKYDGLQDDLAVLRSVRGSRAAYDKANGGRTHV